MPIVLSPVKNTIINRFVAPERPPTQKNYFSISNSPSIS